MRRPACIGIAIFLGLLTIMVGCSDKGTKPDGNGTIEDAKNPRIDSNGLTFFYTPDAGVTPRSVYLMGSFNGWTPDDAAMQLKAGADGRWSVTVQLDKGRHEYKFVINGKQLPDKISREIENDGFGGIKSYVTVK
ncbi:MAG TPA: glycogen-binding domain-containing protein [Spirochaetota bacterium]|mgnify:CR=1 FL=1|nr:glycogen-binding domain-containing protein [Spirochaetota bacterium]HPH03442.1 glycogen-binding domain-containing protein [Spirochaetota bacterium]